ncbi:hypothetical protein NLJ89_g6135 [Agrocybe chaxingu]|uniref:Uncharacterized protein n=1 Tax=Agrocybe chaxingu TaxID=84603 RepID=A0A9W8JZQ9_9AGAR|nr:hypothetical protein NLJ89_g6135 [Agrocybe chaxingu]
MSICGLEGHADPAASTSAMRLLANGQPPLLVPLSAYLILELPSSIPRMVGRRVRASVLARVDERDVHFVDAHAGRISRETRKVLRLASWDLKDRFRGAMEERSREVKGAEEMEKKALRAKECFTPASWATHR